MSSKLIIRLKNQSTQPMLGWALFEGGTIKGTGEVSVADAKPLLSDMAKNSNQIIVLVPGQAVLLTTVVLPKLSAARLAKALPFALEDQLVEDPANLHIAIGLTAGDNLIPVAIVNKTLMNEWQALLKSILEEAYVQVKAFIPDMLVLPLQDQSVTLYQEEPVVLARLSKMAGFVIDQPSALSLLQLHFTQKGVEKPATLTCYQSTKTPLFSEADCRELGVQLQIEKLTAETLYLFTNAMTEWPINLLQGHYAPYQRLIQFERLVGIGFALVGAWLLMLTFVDLVQYSLLHREKKSLDKQLIMLYQAVHPTAVLPEQPKALLQKELADLKARTADSTFVRLLSTIGPSLVPLVSSGMTPLQATFRDNQLMLEVEASDTGAMDSFKQSLDAMGLKVTMSNAERSPDGLIKTRFTIEEIS